VPHGFERRSPGLRPEAVAPVNVLAPVVHLTRRRAQELRSKGTHGLAGVHRRVPAGSVALTFDDGPHPSSTNAILDVLAALSAVATFFCVGRNASRHPGIVHRAVAEGHAIGSHSRTHPPAEQTSIRLLNREYRDGKNLVSDVVGKEVSLFRPPYGYLRPASAAVIRRGRLRTWLWTVDP